MAMGLELSPFDVYYKLCHMKRYDSAIVYSIIFSKAKCLILMVSNTYVMEAILISQTVGKNERVTRPGGQD
jgi:hypothetical protein